MVGRGSARGREWRPLAKCVSQNGYTKFQSKNFKVQVGARNEATKFKVCKGARKRSFGNNEI